MNKDLPTAAPRRMSIPFACLAIAGAISFFVGITFGLWFDTLHAGQKAWVTLAKFGASLGTYAVTMQWLLFYVRRNLPLVRFSSIAACLGGVLVLMFLFIEALAATFNAPATELAVLTHLARMAIIPPTVLLTVSFKAVLEDTSHPSVLRAGLFWATGLAVLGCVPAVLMLIPEAFPGISALQTLTTKESHEILKTSHFIGLHALQIMPIYCWLVSSKNLPTDRQLTLVNSVGWALAALVGILTVKGLMAETLMAASGLTVLLGGVVAFGIQKTLSILISGNPLQIWQGENL